MQVPTAGGGVGGLTLALSLRERGIGCTVFEAAERVRPLGVGINTLPHAIRELAALGLLPALDDVAVRTRELRYLNRFGQEIWIEKRGTWPATTCRSSPSIAAACARCCGRRRACGLGRARS